MAHSFPDSGQRQTARAELSQHGRAWLRGALDEAAVASLEPIAEAGSRPGARSALAGAPSAALVKSGLNEIIAGMLDGAKPVRLVLFNKSADQNWGVPWHQDRLIAVSERAPVAGYDNWSSKRGVWHCEPPEHILRNMLFVRVHLDDAVADNGAMEVALGSHLRGAAPASDALHIAESLVVEPCVGNRGDILICSMFTLHRSPRSASGAPRRALRIDYASGELPHPLKWAP